MSNNSGAQALDDRRKDVCCCMVCLLFIEAATIPAAIFILKPQPPPSPQVQLTAASVSATSNLTISSSVWHLTLQVAFPEAAVVHYDSFRASVLFDSGSGRGQLEMAAANLPAPFEEKGEYSTFNLRLDSKPEASSSVQVVGSILSDMVAAGSADFGVRVVASVRIDTEKKQTKLVADCNPVRIGFPDPQSTAAGGLSGSLPISITCDVQH
ncbi:unnamed protein product [Linum trigynum]|uniref:Late embryogenesis abundant protein LEA-2 subgroup domain-containing protein n=1 Tax=Linum trigynum TaxID=586398 RepID=A0AAV2FAA2_9ROSI